MVSIPELIQHNQLRWDHMVLDQARINSFDTIAKEVCGPDAKARYQAVSTRIKTLGYQPVPWWFVAVVSVREYGGPGPKGAAWDKQLAQGDPLSECSTHEPRGRGPFLNHPSDNALNNSWVRGCLDALIDCAPHAALWHDWSAGGTATIFEEYNGLGYAMRGVPSAYVWSGSDQYISGKYVADHMYSPNTRDVQEGCMPILRRMMVLDNTIEFGGVNPIIVPPLHPVTTPIVTPTNPVHNKGLVQELLDAWNRL